MGVWYATREDVSSALDTGIPWRMNRQVDNALENASRKAEGLLHRRFYPEIATKDFPWPSRSDLAPGWILWLNDNELVSLTSLTSGGTAIDPSDVLLEPQAYGPPYNRVELNRATTASFRAGDTPQRAISLTGTFGYDIDERLAATLTGSASSSASSVASSDSQIGVGSLIRIDSEYMIVTGKTQSQRTVTLSSDLLASKAQTTIPVSSGSGIIAGESILIDSEYMLVLDIAGNNLIVERAQYGSTLATHTSSTALFSPRTLMVLRGQLGTTAASHNSAASIFVFNFQGTVRELVVAYVLRELQNRQGAYSNVVGSGDSSRRVTDEAIKTLEDQAVCTVGRQGRIRAA